MSNYKALSEEQAVKYVMNTAKIFKDDAVLSSCEIGDGNLNLVFQIREDETGKSVILKQALPYLRVVGNAWPLTVDRSRIEVEATRLHGQICPGRAPKIYFNDTDMALSVMEDLTDMKIMRFELMKMRRFTQFPYQLGDFVARTLFFTSDIAMDSIEKKKLVDKFINPELCKITEDLIFTHPYYNAEENIINPKIIPFLQKEWWTVMRLG